MWSSKVGSLPMLERRCSARTLLATSDETTTCRMKVGSAVDIRSYFVFIWQNQGFRAPSVSIGKNLEAIISLITVETSDFVRALAMLAPSPVSPIPLSIVIISFCSHSVQLVSLKTKIMSMMIDLVCNFLVSEHVEQLGLNVARS